MNHTGVLPEENTHPVKKRLIAVMGPTASGKTSLAISLARQWNTEIISVDSRQFYQEMTIGTAKPTPDQLAEVKHHFVNNLSITDHYTAGHFARQARLKIEELFETHDTVIAAGGSTLYFKALLEGIDSFPEVTEEAKNKVLDIEVTGGIKALQEALKYIDPEYYALVDQANPRRLVRALEVSYSAGQPYSTYLNQEQWQPGYSIEKTGLNPDREILYKRINDRCDEMMAEGLLAEVETLLPYRHLKPLHTVGYTEFFEYMEGKHSLQEAISLFKQHTRNYAKRQLTWLRKEPGLQWNRFGF